MKLFGKKERYVLRRMDGEEGEEEIGRFKEFINRKTVLGDIESGELEEGSYKLFQVVDGKEVRKWTIPKVRQPKKVSSDDVLRMDKDEAFKAVSDKAEELKGQVKDFKAFRDGVLQQFGEGAPAGTGDITIPTDLKGLSDGFNRGMGRAAYTGLAKRDDEFVDNLFGIIGGIGDLATGVGFLLASKAGPESVKKLMKKRDAREKKADERSAERAGEEAEKEAVEKEVKKEKMLVKETETGTVTTFGKEEDKEVKMSEKEVEVKEAKKGEAVLADDAVTEI